MYPFDGSANINLPGVNSAGNQDTTGNAATSTLSVSSQGLTGSPNITVTDVNAVDAIISGNLSVAGTITSLDQNDILATGIITASSGVDLGDPGIVTLSSDTLTNYIIKSRYSCKCFCNSQSICNFSSSSDKRDRISCNNYQCRS